MLRSGFGLRGAMIRSVRVGVAFALVGGAALLGPAAKAEQGASDSNLLFNTQRAAHWGLRLSPPARPSLDAAGAQPGTLEPAPSPATTGSSERKIPGPSVGGSEDPPRQSEPVRALERLERRQAVVVHPPAPRIEPRRPAAGTTQPSRSAARARPQAPRRSWKAAVRRVAKPAPAAPFHPPPVPVLEPGHDWSGLHIGASAGAGWGDFAIRETGISAPSASTLAAGFAPGLALERRLEANGFLGGAQIGVSAQRGAFVLGLEADLGWADLDRRANAVASTGFASLPGPSFAPVRAGLDLLGTVRARAGVAFERVLVYGTGGVATARVAGTALEAATAIPSPALAAGDRRTHVGWTAGAGIEAMITPKLSARLEYLYADVSALRHGPLAEVAPVGRGLAGGPPARLAGVLKAEMQTVKIGLNYRFSLSGP